MTTSACHLCVLVEVSPRLLKVVGGRGGCPGLLSDLSECILFSLVNSY